MKHPFALDKLELMGILFVFIFSFVFFFKDTFMFSYCLMAAIMTTALVAASYLIMKWFYISLK